MGLWDFWRGAPSQQPTTSSNVSQPQESRLLDDPSAKPSSPTLEQVASQPTPKNRNVVLFGAGVTFFAFSILISRRSLARRRLANAAANFTPSTQHPHPPQVPRVSPAFEAFEALNIATINVLSLAMLATGGAAWYLNLNSLDDARRFVRGGLGIDGTGKTESEAEEEFEEWMATVLSRKEAKEKRAQTEGRNGAK